MAASRHLTLRISPEQLAAIDVRARAAGLSRTEFMVRSALGELVDPVATDSRVDELERRLNRLEETVFNYS